MITWEEVTPELKKLDKHRKIGLIFSFVAAGIFAFPTAFGDSELNPFQKILYSIGTTLVMGLVFGAIVSGFLHTQGLRQKSFVNYPHFRSLCSLRSGGLSVSSSADDFQSPTSLECFTAD